MSMVLQLLLLKLILVLVLPIKVAVAVTVTNSEALPECPEKCGNVSIPYPFGIGKGCYMHSWFSVICDNEIPFYGTIKRNTGIEILNISLGDGQVHVNGFYSNLCYDSQGQQTESIDSWTDLYNTPFIFSVERNKFFTIGCDTIGYISEFKDQDFTSGCVSLCNDISKVKNDSCSGIGCCMIPIPEELKRFDATLQSFRNHTRVNTFNPCGYAFLADENLFSFQVSDLSPSDGLIRRPNISVAWDWAIGDQTCLDFDKDPKAYVCGQNSKCVDSTNGSGYRCDCKPGYQGNPYLPQGCHDINECEVDNPCNSSATCNNTDGSYNCICPSGYHGNGKINGNGCTRDTQLVQEKKWVIAGIGIGVGCLVLFIGAFWFNRVLQERKLIKMKEKLFQQNGGLLLERQIASRKGASSDVAKIFTVKELEKATNNYDRSRIIGQGAFGIVYRGILRDNRVVAIKKSIRMDESQILQFLNEVDILSQIKHRNVVKLLGCCLEVEVPLLVYEFIPNGTLYQHIHNKTQNHISWKKRLTIGAETAVVLDYLHSQHSTPIIHRDVKSANILLDDDYTAKVSDFGASRLVPQDQAQLTNTVVGTLGYLDPEYHQSGKLTPKSDVYSFGVVLVELLTGMKPWLTSNTEEHRTLLEYFKSLMEEKASGVIEIVDQDILRAEVDKEEIIVIADLASRCLREKGVDRPTMKEVATQLEELVRFHKQTSEPLQEEQLEEKMLLLGEPSNHSTITNINSTHYSLQMELLTVPR